MFKPPADNAQTPLKDLPFWQWLANQGKGALRASRKTDLGVVCDYLKTCGFEEGRDKVAPETLDLLLEVFKTFWQVAPEIGPRKLSDVFTAEAGGFYVSGLDGNQRYSVTPDVVQALQAAGWVYGITPQTTYFEISNGRVWAKYSQILGQRCLFETQE